MWGSLHYKCTFMQLRALFIHKGFHSITLLLKIYRSPNQHCFPCKERDVAPRPPCIHSLSDTDVLAEDGGMLAKQK